MSGLTDAGLVIESIDDIRTATEQDLRDTFFASLPLGDTTLLGHMVGIIAEQLGLAWERLEQVNSSQDPDKASGPALDAVSVLTGTFRAPATKSHAVVTLCGDPTTVVAAGSVVTLTSATTTRFDTRDDATIAALAVWTINTAYAVADRVTNSGKCFECITAGTSAGAGGPTTDATDITDNTAHWKCIGTGTAAVDVTADAEAAGPTVATAYDLSTIQTPVSGWTTARNLHDATEGADANTDEELRLLRTLELAGTGSTTRDATRAAILKLPGVVSCSVFANNTDATDADGLPPHSFEVLVRGGVAQDIVDAIAANQPEGIATYSSTGTSGTHVDSEGISQTIYYTRPEEIAVYVIVNATVDSSIYPADGGAQIKSAIVTWGSGQATGKNAVSAALVAQSFTVDGVIDVPSCYLDIAPAPAPASSATIAISRRQLAVYDTTRITVNATPGTP